MLDPSGVGGGQGRGQSAGTRDRGSGSELE